MLSGHLRTTYIVCDFLYLMLYIMSFLVYPLFMYKVRIIFFVYVYCIYILFQPLQARSFNYRSLSVNFFQLTSTPGESTLESSRRCLTGCGIGDEELKGRPTQLGVRRTSSGSCLLLPQVPAEKLHSLHRRDCNMSLTNCVFRLY